MSEHARSVRVLAMNDIYSALGVMSYSGRAGERVPTTSISPKANSTPAQASSQTRQSRKRVPQHVLLGDSAGTKNGSGSGQTQLFGTKKAGAKAAAHRNRGNQSGEGGMKNRDATGSKDVLQYQMQMKLDTAKKSKQKSQPTSMKAGKSRTSAREGPVNYKATRRRVDKNGGDEIENIEDTLEQSVEDAEIKPVESMTSTKDSMKGKNHRLNSDSGRKGDQTSADSKEQDQSLRYQESRPHPWLSVRDDPSNPRYNELLKDYKKELDYYRSIERGHGISTGRVSDPEQKTTLAEAIVFKGSCNDMCPMHERVTRLLEKDTDRCEKVDGFPKEQMMVKRFQRSSAGKLPPLPSEVRTPATLKQSTIYLLDIVLEQRSFHDAHRFVWDRTRSIRTDFSYYSSTEWDNSELRIVVYCYERIARFHLMAMHYFAHHPDEKPDSFSRVQEIEQLVATIVTLKAIYEVCTSRGLRLPTFPYFLALWGIVFGHQGNVSTQLAAHAASNPRDMRLLMLTGIYNQVIHSLIPSPGPAIGPRAVLQNSVCAKTGAELSTGEVPIVIALFLEYSFNKIRETALSHLRDAIASNRMTKKDATPYFLAEFLYFDDLSPMNRWLEHVSPPIKWKQDDIGQEKWADFDLHAPISVNHSLVEVPTFPKLAKAIKNITSIDSEEYQSQLEPAQTKPGKAGIPVPLLVDGHPTSVVRIDDTESPIGEMWSDSDVDDSTIKKGQITAQAKLLDYKAADKSAIQSLFNQQPQSPQLFSPKSSLNISDVPMIDGQDRIESPVGIFGPTAGNVQPQVFNFNASPFQPRPSAPVFSFSQPSSVSSQPGASLFTAPVSSQSPPSTSLFAGLVSNQPAQQEPTEPAPAIVEQKPAPLFSPIKSIFPGTQPPTAEFSSEKQVEVESGHVALSESLLAQTSLHSAVENESLEENVEVSVAAAEQEPEKAGKDVPPIESATGKETSPEIPTSPVIQVPQFTREEQIEIWKEMTLLVGRRGPKPTSKSNRVGKRQTPYASSATGHSEIARSNNEVKTEKGRQQRQLRPDHEQSEPSSTKREPPAVQQAPHPLSAKEIYEAEFDDSLMLAESQLASTSINFDSLRPISTSTSSSSIATAATTAKSAHHAPPSPPSPTSTIDSRSRPTTNGRRGWLDQTASTYWKRLAAGVDDEALGIASGPGTGTGSGYRAGLELGGRRATVKSRRVV